MDDSSFAHFPLAASVGSSTSYRNRAWPATKKIHRMAVVVAHGVDPRLQDQARVLIKQLGDVAAKARESAEAQLFEMGPVAVPVLEDALREQDVEVVYRAERLLLRLNRPVP